MDRTVQSLFLEFTVGRVKLKIDRKSKIIAVAGIGEKLACSLGDSDIPGVPKSAGCTGMGEPFTWPRVSKSYCPLHFVRSAKGIMTGRMFCPHSI